MKKLVISFSLILIPFFSAEILAQQDSLYDIFPLNIGNNLNYGFEIKYGNYELHNTIRDNGLIKYLIFNASFSDDTTIWDFRGIRNFTRYTYTENDTALEY